MVNLLITLIFSFLLIYICNKNQYLLNFTGSSHQQFTVKKSVPLLGGLIIIFFLIISISNSFLSLKVFLTLIFFVGLMSDLKILNSPGMRFLIQIVIISIGIYILQISIIETKIIFLNNLINKNELLNLILLSFVF